MDMFSFTHKSMRNCGVITGHRMKKLSSNSLRNVSSSGLARSRNSSVLRKCLKLLLPRRSPSTSSGQGLEGIEQPGPSKAPVAPRRAIGYPERLSRLFHTEPGKEAQFDQLRCASVFPGQPFQGRVYPQQQILARFLRQIDLIQVHALEAAAVPLG